MATAQELADAALQLARGFLASHPLELAALAAGDTAALVQATRLVHGGLPSRPARARADEHIAFALLSTAFQEAVQRRRLELDARAASTGRLA
ncbi:MAG TPA: hypothetical protein VFA70_04965 [Dehalococcoidia bacterium]|jgi:hypothetical protein|nr:hypothetical protein [Dehalococcoidia bacterium]